MEALLGSPKWKALLSWDDEAHAPAGTGADMALDTAGSGGSASSQMPSNTAVALGFGAEGSASEGPPVSPGVDQEAGTEALEAAWRDVLAAQQRAAAAAAAGSILVPQPQPEGQAEPQPEQLPHRPRGFGAKKRPGPEPEAAEGAAPPAKHRRSEAPLPSPQQQQQPGGYRLATFKSERGDVLMIEAEGPAVAAGQEAKEDLSPADVLSGLNRVRLNSIDSTQQQQAAAVQQQQRLLSAARVTPRQDASAAALMGSSPPATMAVVAQLPPAPGVQLLAPFRATEPDATAAVWVKPEPCSKQAARAAKADAAKPTAAAPPPAAFRSKLPTKSHKAVATGGLWALLFVGIPAVPSPRLHLFGAGAERVQTQGCARASQLPGLQAHSLHLDLPPSCTSPAPPAPPAPAPFPTNRQARAVCSPACSGASPSTS